MANHGHQPTQTIEGTDELDQEEPQPQTYDDKLAADLYKDYSSQNELAKQLIIALSLTGISYGKEVIEAYNLLKKPLDPEKLIKDPIYKKRVERAVQLVKRHEGKRLKTGRSKYTATIQRTEDGLKWTRFAHERTEDVKKNLSSQYSIDMRKAYGLGDEEIKAISQGALERIKERPELSMREAMRIEARTRFLQRKVETEVDKEEKYNNFVKRFFRRKERDEEIKGRITIQEEDFISRTSNVRELEKELTDKRIEEGTKHVASSLEVEYKPRAIEQPASSVVPTPQIQPMPTTQAVPPPAIPAAPTLPPTLVPSPPPTPIPPAPGIPSSPPGIPSFFSSAKSFFGGLGKNKQALLDGAGVLASGGTNLVAKLGLKALDSILKATIGIDAKTAGLIAVCGVIGIFALGIVKGISLFSHRTSENPVTVRASLNNKIYSWQEFEKKFLVQPKNELSISWQQFEKENLIPAKEYLSKNQKEE